MACTSYEQEACVSGCSRLIAVSLLPIYPAINREGTAVFDDAFFLMSNSG